LEASDLIRKNLNGLRKEEAGEAILHMFTHTRNNEEFVQTALKRLK
jgi:transcription termination factor Rho